MKQFSKKKAGWGVKLKQPIINAHSSFDLQDHFKK